MEILPGLAMLGGFLLVLIMGAAILVDRVRHGRAAVEDAPGWACWGAHIVIAFAAMSVAYGLALHWDMSMPVRGVISLAGLVGGYYAGIRFVGEGSDPD